MNLKLYNCSIEKKIMLPYVGGISAGFTSPADDYLAEKIDLNEILIKHPYYTFIAQADGDCLEGANISNGDLIIVDKSLKPKDGNLAVCFIDGDFTLKRVLFQKDNVFLVPDPSDKNKHKYKPIIVTEDNRFIIWGIVTYSIKSQL